MKKIFFILIIPILSFGQNLVVQNPSFEGPIGAGITPAPWFTCMAGQTPDTQPGVWGVDLPASDGATYLGFVQDIATGWNWQEGATQELVDEADQTTPLPMTAGTNYQFTIDLAGYEFWSGVTFFADTELLIYGGFMTCPQNELLWSSGDTPDNVWTTYTVNFTPSADYTYIMLQCNIVGSSVYGSILVDNMTPIIPQCQLLIVENMGESCEGNDGFIETSIVSDGDATPPYSYLWSNGATTPDIYNLSPGIYDLEVTDSDGDCVAYLSQEITGLNVEGVEINNICEGENEGSINVTVTGGTGNYTYDWSNGEITEDVSDLNAGTYFLTVADANGCEISVEFTVSEPDALSASISVSDVSCNGDDDGSGQLTVTGGTAPYDIEDLTGLSAGTYTTIVMDDNDCELSVEFTVSEPDALSASISVSDVACNGDNDGSGQLTVTGGTAPYDTEDLTGLSAGTYTTIVVDDNGCETSVGFTVSEPNVLSASISVSDVSCNGGEDGSGQLTVTGGTVPYNTEDLTGLSAGTYTTTVVDDNGCETLVEFTVLEPDPTFIMISGDECNQNFDVSLTNLNVDFEQWILIEYPEGDPSYFDNPTNPSTELTINELGQYTIGAIICGDTITHSMFIDEGVYVLNGIYQHCVLSANVLLYPNNGVIDFLEGPSDPIISYNSGYSSANIVVENFGLYEFQYTACSEVYYFHIAFGCPPIIPNALTLNGDENNDLFVINLATPELYHESMLTIFNRWGQIVHIHSNYGFYNDWWDGTHMYTNQKVNNGTYYYTLELFHKFKDEKNVLSGYIHIIGQE